MTAIEDDECSQKKGMVAIDYSVGCRQIYPKSFDAFRNMSLVSEALPVRTASVHFCYDSAQFRAVAIFIQNAMNKELRLRFRAHCGPLQFAGHVLFRMPYLVSRRQLTLQLNFELSLQVPTWNVNTS